MPIRLAEQLTGNNKCETSRYYKFAMFSEGVGAADKLCNLTTQIIAGDKNRIHHGKTLEVRPEYC